MNDLVDVTSVVDEVATSRLEAEPLMWVTEEETRAALPLQADPVVDDGEDAALATTIKHELIQQQRATDRFHDQWASIQKPCANYKH